MEVRDTLGTFESQMEQETANSLFKLYLSLQAIHEQKAFLQKRLVAVGKVMTFITAIRLWFSQCKNSNLSADGI